MGLPLGSPRAPPPLATTLATHPLGYQLSYHQATPLATSELPPLILPSFPLDILWLPLKLPRGNP